MLAESRIQDQSIRQKIQLHLPNESRPDDVTIRRKLDRINKIPGRSELKINPIMT